VRRPSPLPVAPTEVAPAGTGRASTGAGPRRPSAGPASDARAKGRGSDGGRETETVGAGIPDDASDAIGIRDVWRAARARRKALRAEARRFTARQRRRRAVWIGVAASVFVLVAGTLGAAYSPLFAVQDIQVVGTRTLGATTVEKALDGQLGRPFPLIDSSEIKAALVRFPLVESYTLEARPPHELVVRIVERTPVGAIKDAAGYTVVDAAGVALATTATPPAGEPIISVAGGVHSDAFQSVGAVMRALPASIRDVVTAVSATTPDDVTLRLGGTRTTVVWGSADQSAMKAEVLEQAMRAMPPSGVSQYDVSTPTSLVVR